MLKITKVAQNKYNKNRYSIFINDDYAFSVSEDVLINHSLLKGKELDKEFIDKVLLSEEKDKAKSIALKYLGYKMRSEKEVREKLNMAGYCDYSDEVIDYLLKNQYLDDREYAFCYTKEKLNLKGYGKIRITMELNQKGIDSSLVNEALSNFNYEDREFEMALELAEKRSKRSFKNDEDKYRKIYGYLLRQGYSNDIVKKVLNELI